MQRGLARASVVYIAKNILNGKFYIGVTMAGLAACKRGHLHAARNGGKGKFYNAIRKYGEDNFFFSVLVAKLAAKKRGTMGYWRGKKRPPETIEKFRAAALANPSRYWLGKKRAAETIEKIASTKRSRSYPITDRMLESANKNIQCAIDSVKKPVLCTSYNMYFPSAQNAAFHFGVSRTSVARAAAGKRRAIYGLKFKYLEAA